MAFYFKCSISYNKKNIEDKINLASYEVGNYFLTNAKSVKNVVKLASNINITDKTFEAPLNITLPLHWFISDSKGNCVVAEASNGKLIFYNNSKYKVCTNNPTFPKQIKT